ncbi:uncharacterized protein N7469_008785 [Penicillium citrinum]|uniref:Uncharacterized protein n=2 Tax=Penicillium TaxID=5073 RepID=A0A9W9TII2_PENCI|nr:uncharacterized protein N7469_008785 [Penicillium citrinum]KAJ5222545.1 hypothetical protein N7469_008785 [Penicillium citrinum]KAJ5580701.1 hypothetical protein N7450_007002 [Penicillium hetheringtonii]
MAEVRQCSPETQGRQFTEIQRSKGEAKRSDKSQSTRLEECCSRSDLVRVDASSSLDGVFCLSCRQDPVTLRLRVSVGAEGWPRWAEHSQRRMAEQIQRLGPAIMDANGDGSSIIDQQAA